MANGDDFEFEHHSRVAASDVSPEHYDEFMRLSKALNFGPDFQLLIAEFDDESYRAKLVDRIERVLVDAERSPARLSLQRARHPDFHAVEQELRDLLASGHRAVQVFGGDAWFDGVGWESFNLRREALAREVPLRMLWWLTAGKIRELALHAPDLWHWRSGVFDFSTGGHREYKSVVPSFPRVDNRRLGERTRRIGELRQALKGLGADEDELRANLASELANLLQSIGELDESMRIRREQCLPLYEKLGDLGACAVTLGRIADIHQARGDLDEALRIHIEEELPAAERLGDIRLLATTLGRVADVHQARGELDKALRLRRDECLPVYTKLGDERARAAVLGKIADIYQVQGELDEALRLRREECLPVYEKHGDVRSLAVIQSKIADIHHARNESDKALCIWREECLPVFELLGDMHSRVVTLGKIADIHEARGDLDLALRIRQKDELPAYERLGDMRSRAVTLGKIADIHQARGEFDEVLRVRLAEELPIYEKVGDVRSRAITLGQIADIHEARGEFDQALALHAERLPIAELMGDSQSIAHIYFSRARIRLARGDLKTDAQALLEDLAKAFSIVSRLGRPDGIAATGWSLAQVLASTGKRGEALEVLDQVDAAWRKLGNEQGLKAAADLRSKIVSDQTAAVVKAGSTSRRRKLGAAKSRAAKR